MKTLDEMMAAMHEASLIRCPACHDVFDDIEPYLITYHGDDPPVHEICPSCGVVLTIDEHVERTYTVTLTPDDNGVI